MIDLVKLIEGSVLFDEIWYKKKYNLFDEKNLAEHYLTKGWRLGYDSSPFFSTRKYLQEYPDVKEADINPLLHFELYGYGENRYADLPLDEIRKWNPDLTTDMKDGLLRVRVTNACNSKCRYCGVRLFFGSEKNHEMDKKWLYELCTPLYDKVKIILLTGGDPYILRDSYEYMTFLSKNYKATTIMTESNGIAFDKKYQELAASNLFKTHFSLNASNREVFQKGCWEGKGGEHVFDKMIKHVCEYVELLQNRGLESFTPSFSMVINKDNYYDIEEFTKMALMLKVQSLTFYFDYTENDMFGDYFGNPETSRFALRKLMEIERVLAGKVMVYFRLWLPGKETQKLQSEVELIPQQNLENKYTELLKLASNRSMKEEFEKRNYIRAKQGKRQFTFDEDFAPTIRMERKNGQDFCFAPWKEVDLYPDGRVDFCGWYKPTSNFNCYIKNGVVDWNNVINSFEFMRERKKILRKNYDKCQSCCPMNDVVTPITSVFEYGYNRIKNDK